MRLIDADALLLLASMRRDGMLSTMDIESAPKFELKIVLCKDCKFRKYDISNAEYYCNNDLCCQVEVRDNDFCSHGERKDNEV